MEDQTQPAKAVRATPPPIDHHDITWIQQESKRLNEYTGNPHLGYQFRYEIIPLINRLISIRLGQFVHRSRDLQLTVNAVTAEEVQRHGFTLELELYGARASRRIQLTQLDALFLDDSFARQVTHDMISLAARTKWGR